MRFLPWLLALLSVAVTAEARFADTQGFSGRHGVTCGACHPTEAAYAGEPVRVVAEGLPAAYDLDADYPFRIRVEGGPPGNPAPQTPQAGFDVEVDRGSLAPGGGMDGLLRFPSSEEATYTGRGTFVRSWNLVWHSPGLTQAPAPVSFWVAGLAANGNHIMDGPDTMGARGDRFHTVVLQVHPSGAAQDAWTRQPITPPSLDPLPAFAPGRPLLVTGQVPDFADGAEGRIDNGSWISAIGAPGFVLTVDMPAPGAHTLEARTVWAGRTSPSATVAFEVPISASAAGDNASAERPTWVPVLWMLLLVLLLSPFLLMLRR